MSYSSSVELGLASFGRGTPGDAAARRTAPAAAGTPSSTLETIATRTTRKRIITRPPDTSYCCAEERLSRGLRTGKGPSPCHEASERARRSRARPCLPGHRASAAPPNHPRVVPHFVHCYDVSAVFTAGRNSLSYRSDIQVSHASNSSVMHSVMLSWSPTRWSSPTACPPVEACRQR
jgi:hypothetical protein